MMVSSREGRPSRCFLSKECHCEERSDVAISCKLEIRSLTEEIPTGLAALGMTVLKVPSRNVTGFFVAVML